jgi:hypothetical protein
MGRGPGDQVEAQMHDVAIMTLAAGGKGGGRLVLLAMLAVIVVLAAGWALHAARVRAGRGKKP